MQPGFIALLQLAELLLAVQVLLFQYHVPAGPCVFGVQVEGAFFHARLDVGRTASHSLGQLDFQIRILLNEQFQHLAQDVLFRHGFGGNTHHPGLFSGPQQASAQAQEQCRRPQGQTPVLPPCSGSPAPQPLFHEPQQPVCRQGQQGNQQAPGNGQCRMVGGDAPVNGYPQPAGADKGSDAGQGDGHDHHVPDPGKNHRQGQRQLDFPQNLGTGAPHAFGGFQDGRIHLTHTGAGIAHHGQQGIDGQGKDGRPVADPGKGDQKAQHGNGRNGIEKIDGSERRSGSPAVFADQDAGNAAQHQGCQTGRQRDFQVFQQQAGKEFPFFHQQVKDVPYHVSPLCLQWL